MKSRDPHLSPFALALALGCAFCVSGQTPDRPPQRDASPPGADAGFPPPDGGPGFGGPPGFGPGGFGPGGPGGMMGQETPLVKEFDKDGDGRLNNDERKAARASLAQKPRNRGPGGFGGRRGGFGGPGESQTPPQPGPKLSPAEVKSFPDAPLYDPLTLRTFFLEFENADWEKELADFNNTDVEVPAKLTVDGRTYPDVGVHFRGMTSFMFVGEGRKRPLNLALDFVHKGQQFCGYRTLNLLNSHEDPTFLRTVLYSHIAREYLPAPKANYVRLVINGESWGVYVNAQQVNKDFAKDFFGTTKGARWKVPGSPGGRGGLEYLGEEVAPYRQIYSIKSKDDPKSWAALMRLCRVLNETPLDQLEGALTPLLDLDGVLKFLALDNALSNNDGFWTRASDYYLYRDTQGRFHIIPSDTNESFSEGGGPGGPGGFGGRGGRGGPGGFGPGMFVAPQLVAQADQNADQKLTREEFTALADAWFTKLDPDKTGKLSQEQFAAKLGEVLPAPQGFGPPRAGGPGDGQQGGRGRGGFGPAMFLGSPLFTALDADKDGSLTQVELKGTFGKWFGEWDSAKSGALQEEQVREGLNAVLPAPNFGGPGGGRGGPGGGRGRGGPGFGGGPGGGGVKLDPLVDASDSSKPLISRLLAVPSLRTRYLGYIRDIAERWLDWSRLGPVAQQYQTLIAEDVKADTRKLDSTEAFLNGLTGTPEGQGSGGGFGGGQKAGLKSFAENRRAYLLEQTSPGKTGK